MEDLPPSYGSLFNSHRSGLSYIDFLPDCIKAGFFSKPKYEKFEYLIDCANEWLRLNPQWNIKTCESIEFKDNRGVINHDKMLYYENGKYTTNFIRGLRLWLQLFPPGEERVQKIGYVNLVPVEVVQGGIFTNAKYETLDEVLLKFNDAARTAPLPGRIITIETQEMKIKSGGVIDPDRSSWTEYGEGRYMRYIYVIRIFYEIGDPSYEKIGIADFVPEVTESSCLGSCPKYETFSTLFERASYWCSSRSDIRVCNIQSIAIKVQDGINTMKMSYTEYGNYRVSYVNILRVAHIHQQPMSYSSPMRFSCKSFVPAQLKPASCSTCFKPVPETLQETMQRVSNWIQATGAEVLNMETCAVRLRGKGAIQSSEESYVTDTGHAEYYIFVIRAYLKGSYSEPFEDNLTPLSGVSYGGAFALGIVIGFIIFTVILLLIFFSM